MREMKHISNISNDTKKIRRQQSGIETIKYHTKNSEYDQEIPQSQTADKPMVPRGKATQQSRETKKTNLAKQPALSSLSV